MRSPSDVQALRTTKEIVDEGNKGSTKLAGLCNEANTAEFSRKEEILWLWDKTNVFRVGQNELNINLCKDTDT
jgi:hypothetical protein